MSISKSDAKSWKKEYLRILISGPVSENDWSLAKELIDSGYGDGTFFYFFITHKVPQHIPENTVPPAARFHPSPARIQNADILRV